MGFWSSASPEPILDSQDVEFGKNQHAGQLFDGISVNYDRLSQMLSFFEAGSWRRQLISRLDAHPGDKVLDICTGTAVVGLKIAKTSGAQVVGLDLSEGMLRQAQRNVAKAGMEREVSLLKGRAESLGFGDGAFDSVCFTWLMRYVESPRTTLQEIVRVLKPGGKLVSLEFGVPENPVYRSFWSLYSSVALPIATRLMSPGWRYVGNFLGPSITGFYKEYPLADIRQMWVESGISGVQVKKLSFGAGVLMWGTKDR